MIKDIKKNKKLILLIGVLLIFTIGVTLAYFQGQIGSGATANVTVNAKTTDVLTFSKGNDINITATQANFGSGAGNRTGSTTATASLRANNNTNSASQTYNVYFKIDSNAFVYTTAPTNTPELLLTVTNPSNQAVTSISGLTYTTVNGVSGFDITTQRGLIQIASNYSITSNSGTTATNQTWNFTVTFINLNSDQQLNTGKFFVGRVIIQKEAITTAYWNDDFTGTYAYSYPLGQKTSDGTTWIDGTPTNYPTLAQLQSNYASFSTKPLYIKTTDKHEACLYYNNSEFCFSPNYWEGTIGVVDEVAATATMNKLKADMEAAFGTSADSCTNGANRQSVCYFNYLYCYANYNGFVSCHNGNYRHCEASPEGYAYCNAG